MIDQNKTVLSLDIGTSSVKAMKSGVEGASAKAKVVYSEASVCGWKNAVKSVLHRIDTGDVAAMSLSAQVGTYIVDDKDVLSWNDVGGDEYLKTVKTEISQEEFEKEISMPHPNIVSYPLPRMLYIRDKFKTASKVCMPKDYFIGQFTGNYCTDAYSWRGLADLKENKYSKTLLDRFGLKFELPRIASFDEQVGSVTACAAKEYGLPEGIPVFAGANDFYCGLLGMGITETGAEFNLSGTSEHIGVITKDINRFSPVSGPYFFGNATYGGTKSSGVCCDFSIREFGIADVGLETVMKSPPIFLPYLCGERAPVFDENARGVFFGLNDKTDKKALAYSVLEGVAFGVYDAGIDAGISSGGKLIGAGGSFVNDFMTKLKAEIFGKEIVRVKENDVSALGAGLIALSGAGFFKDIKDAVAKVVKYERGVKPDGEYSDLIKKRFELYKTLYKDLKDDYKKFNVIYGDKK